MEFVKLVNAFHRMCSCAHNIEGCHICPLNEPVSSYGGDCSTWIVDNPEKAEELISEWLLENPPRTNMSRFIGHYQEVDISKDGFPSVAPCEIDKALRARRKKENGICFCKGIGCLDCRKEFWEKELE